MVVYEKITPTDTLSIAILEWQKTQDVDLLLTVYAQAAECFAKAAVTVCRGQPHLLQEVEERATSLFYELSHQYRGESKFSTVIYGTVVNVARDLARRSKIRARWLNEAKAELKVGRSDSPEKRLMYEDLCVRVAGAINGLSETEKVAWMAYFDELEETGVYERVSKSLGVTRDAVKTRLYRVRKHFKKELADYVSAA